MYLAIIIFLILVMSLVLGAYEPIRSDISLSELSRRSDNGDKNAKSVLQRERLLDSAVGLRDILSKLLILIVILLSVFNFGWFISAVIGFIVIIFGHLIENTSVLKNISLKLFSQSEKTILNFLKKHNILSKFLSSSVSKRIVECRIASVEELQERIDNSAVGILSNNDKKLLINGLSFSKRKVKEIMTPVDDIVNVKRSEFLGPLVLDELHKAGHCKLPVISKDINHIVGILRLEKLLTLDTKRSTTAEKAMDQKVFYIKESQNLRDAVSTFLDTNQDLLIVLSSAGKTVGLVTVSDLMVAIFGDGILNSEIKSHENLRAVMSRNVK